MPNAAHKPFSFLLGLWDERLGFLDSTDVADVWCRS